MKKNIKKVLTWLLDLGINLAIIFVLVMVIQTWIIAPFDVSGASMCDTFNNLNGECVSGYGEKIIINEALYLFGSPKRGDIVVFSVPKELLTNEEEKYFIKRVIGLPGEIVEIKDGYTYITPPGSKESIMLKEGYLSDKNLGKTRMLFDDYPSVFEVPEDSYFVMGDNRNSSTDSRTCFLRMKSELCKSIPSNAFIQEDLIRGKATVVWWPLKSIRLVKNIDYKEFVTESLDEK